MESNPDGPFWPLGPCWRKRQFRWRAWLAFTWNGCGAVCAPGSTRRGSLCQLGGRGSSASKVVHSECARAQVNLYGVMQRGTLGAGKAGAVEGRANSRLLMRSDGCACQRAVQWRANSDDERQCSHMHDNDTVPANVRPPGELPRMLRAFVHGTAAQTGAKPRPALHSGSPHMRV